MHKARFQNCKLDKTVFPSVTVSKPNTPLEFWAPKTLTMNLDPRTALTDSEVKKILDLKSLVEELPDGFTNISRVTRNPLPGAGPAPISIRPERQAIESSTIKKPKISHLSDAPSLTAQPEPEPILCTPPEHELIMTFVQTMASLDSDLLTLEDAKASSDWPKWQVAL